MANNWVRQALALILDGACALGADAQQTLRQSGHFRARRSTATVNASTSRSATAVWDK